MKLQLQSGFLFILVVLLAFVRFCRSAEETKTAAPTTKLTTPTPKITNPPLPTTLPLAACPPQEELKATGCLCYPTMNYLICDGTTNYLSFKSRYQFESLVIKNSPKLPFWSEHLARNSDFQVNQLVIIQEQPVEINENFNDLLRLPEKAIKIVSHGQIDSIQLANLARGLSSISMSNVKRVYHSYYAHYYFGDQTSLEHVHFEGVQFRPEIKDLFLQALPLTSVKIINSGLVGKFGFVPTVCAKDNERIQLDLRGNQLNYLNFTTLFPSAALDCEYHIELGNNPTLFDDLLTSQVAILKAKPKQLFLSFGGLKLECNCQLQSLQKLGYIHGVRCSNYGGEFLDLIKPTDCENV